MMAQSAASKNAGKLKEGIAAAIEHLASIAFRLN